MKKIVLSVFATLLAYGSWAQNDALAQLECKSYQEAVTKHLKNTENAKKATKSGTWLDLGNSYLDLAQRCPDDSSAALKAENAYKKALEIENAAGGKKAKGIETALKSENLAAAYLMQGAAYYNNKNYKEASKFFARSADINQKDTTSALYAGIAEQILENNAGTVKYLTEYINRGGKDPNIFYSIAQVYKSEKKFDDAVAILKKGQSLNPENKDLPNEITNVYLVSNNIDKAVEHLKEMEKLEPENLTNLTNLGIIYDTKTQEFSNEIGKLNKKIEDSKTDKLDKKLLAEQDKLAAYETELASLNTKLKKEPKTATATKKRIADVLNTKKEIESSISSIASEIEAKKSANKDVDTWKNEVTSLTQKQNSVKEQAMSYYNKVLVKDPNNFDVLYNMAVMNYNDAVEIKKVVDFMDIATYRKDGKAVEDKACAKFAEAKPFFERASKAKPSDDIVKEHLANVSRILEQCGK